MEAKWVVKWLKSLVKESIIEIDGKNKLLIERKNAT